MVKKSNSSFRVKSILNFIRHDIWKTTENELSKTKRFFYSSLKTFILAVRGFSEDNLQIKASALTYYTLFAIVPVFALILAIGRGFGFQDLIINSISKQFTVQSPVLPYLLEFVNKYLTHAQGGVFVGVGVAVLFWSVMSGFRRIELIFNDIWQVKKGRTIAVQLSTYFSLMLIVPIFIVASSGLSLFVLTKLSDLFANGLLSPLLNFVLKLSPFFINWILFTGLFIVVPNTKVKILPALAAGVFTGTAFQLFQILYIKGQVYLTAYNAVYGGFAVVPLLLLWLQISWLIVLLGAELSYAAQNIHNYEFDADAQNVSRRYKDFMALLIMRTIVKKFENAEEPPQIEQISVENTIPMRLVAGILNQLVELDLVSEIIDEKTKTKAYQPALDINKITIAYLYNKIEQQGSEGFVLENEKQFESIWTKLESLRLKARNVDGDVLIKDL